MSKRYVLDTTDITHSRIMEILCSTTNMSFKQYFTDKRTIETMQTYFNTFGSKINEYGLGARYINLLTVMVKLRDAGIYTENNFFNVILDTTIADDVGILTAWKEFETTYYDYFVMFADELI